MTDQHKNPDYEDRTARAPYNFVELPIKALKVEDPADQDRFQGHTGFFDCEIETCSPLFVRGMLDPAKKIDPQKIKDLPAPYSLDDGKTPAIPGSSLRGMLRTLIEVVSFSKPFAISNKKQIFRAVGDTTRHGTIYRNRIMQEDEKNTFTPLVQAGYIRVEKGDYYIQPAQKINGTTFARISSRKVSELGKLEPRDSCPNASKIYIYPGPYEYQDIRGGFIRIRFSKALRASANPSQGLFEAALVVSGKMFSKRSEAVVFPPDPQKAERSSWIRIDDQILADYRDQISDEQEDLLGEKGRPADDRAKKGVLKDRQPVFYLVENDKLVFFGHTMMMRLPYKKSPQDLIPQHLRDESSIDLASALFGYAEEKSCAGRVYFSDARCLPGQSDLFEPEIHPHILSGPKPTTFQHYLVQPEPNDKGRLLNYDDNTHLRGYKFYWHKGKRAIADIQELDERKVQKARKQYTTIQPVRSGVRFRFRLRFENLTDRELGALSWALNLGSDPNLRLKLGMAKPLGMGAIKLTSELHLLDVKARYTSLFDQAGAWDSGAYGEEYNHATRAACETAFAQWVLSDHEINPGSLADLRQLPRIRQLVTLLAWPGPNPELTRYMEIERDDPKAKRGKRNEYKDRPVLPDPTGVGKQPDEPRQGPSASPPASRPPAKRWEQTTPPKKTQADEPLPQPRENVSKAAQLFADLLKQRAEEDEDEDEKKKSTKNPKRR